MLDVDFTCQNNLLAMVGYTANKAEWHRYKVVIVPSGFFQSPSFGSPLSLPTLPLASIQQVPLLFGKPLVEEKRGCLIVYADIVASAFFLLSRYEELVVLERDAHGRFPAEASLLGKLGLLQRPLVDEYGALLRAWLERAGVSLPPRASCYKQVYTHDVDYLTRYRSLRGFVGGLWRGEIKQAFAACCKGAQHDPYYLFPWIASLEQAYESRIFIKVGGRNYPQDLPWYNPQCKDARALLQWYPELGLHISYEASLNPALIAGELRLLGQITGQRITCTRHHYLASLRPTDYQYLVDAGVTNDYTMGYAAQAGFRLGTCRPVRWINPSTLQLTPLVLHPLVVMDRSLYDTRYMNLPYSQALNLCRQLRQSCQQWGGEFVSLWHNSEMAQADNYAKKLFQSLVCVG